MTMQRGNFILSCDDEDCDREVDLETTEFEMAKDMKAEMQDNGWTYARKNGVYYDYCPDHSD